MGFDRTSLVLLNVLAVTRLLPVSPLLTGVVATLFLIRITHLMRKALPIKQSRALVFADRSSLPVT